MKILKLGQMLGGSNAPSGGFENLYSLNFVGGTDYLNIPNNTAYTPTSSGWTISVWLKTGAINQHPLVKSDNSSGVEFVLGIAKGSGRVTLIVFANNDPSIYQQFQAHINISDNDWHHVAFTFNNTSSASSFQGYIDGTLYNDATGNATHALVGTWSNPINTSEPIRVGDNSPYNGYNGNVDELSIFDAVLSGGTITDMYNSGTPTDLTGAANLKGWWRNGDTAGTSVYPTIEDYSSVGNDGTMTNMSSGQIVTVVP